MIPDIYGLTPVVEYENFTFKRDDLFRLGQVNGGKLRQAVYLMGNATRRGAKTFLTGGSYLSPQLPIVSTVAKEMQVPLIAYTGCKPETFERSKYGQLVLSNGAQVHYHTNCPRSSAIYHTIKRHARAVPAPYIIQQGIGCFNDPGYFDLLARQVENCPGADTFIMVCGSSTNAIGVLAGIERYKKQYGRIILFGVAPNRARKIFEVTNALGIRIPAFEYIDAFNTLPGYKYENEYHETAGGITLHPRYEAKAYRWLRGRLQGERVLFWVVGGEIGRQ